MPLPPAAALIPVRPGGQILLMLRDDRPDLPHANCWSTIGGAVEVGESPAEAAYRESEEELGRRPAELVPLGTVDGARFRSFLFATRVSWSLDDLILGEGQGVDWLSREAALTAPLAAGAPRGLTAFLNSRTYRELSSGVPDAAPIALPPMPASLCRELGLKAGQLLALQGATAAFVRRLWDILDGVRVTASPAPGERPDAIFWWPRSDPDPRTLASWRDRAAPGGTIWVMPAEGTAEADATVLRLCFAARTLGLIQTGVLVLPTGERALRFGVPSAPD